MKVLFLANFYPEVDNRTSAIFAIKSFFEYKKFWIDFDIITNSVKIKC